jgi:hypothetical protein
MYANFLSFTLGDLDVKWPAWLDTGVILADGSHLSIPMGHSGHAWYISGPTVNAQVMFYLGVGGAAFFGKTDTRAAWSGEADRDVTLSTDAGGEDMILATLEAATTYFQRERIERDTVAAGLPADGYGYVGVCNDSNAIIEAVTRHHGSTDLADVTLYPLMRAIELDDPSVAPDLGDGLDDLVRGLPNDADSVAPAADVKRRVLLMTPHPLDSKLFPDELLHQQLLEISK